MALPQANLAVIVDRSSEDAETGGAASPRTARSVAGDVTPAWVTWTLLAIVVASALLYTVTAASSGYSDYYATAAKAMSVSWKAFFFGAFDPQSTITLDKLAGFLVPQALSARIFGFSAASLAVPQIAEGLVTIVATYFIIRHWIGPVGGLIGAAVMASTPLLVSMFSHPMEDSMLTMFTTLAIAGWQRFVSTRRLRFLVFASTMIGLGFQAKMMQAWLVLPALVLVYLIVATPPLAHKIRELCLAGAVALAVSLSWMTAIALVPAAQRPYIDGTTNNNIFSMVFGFNGIDRFISNFFPGALGTDHAAPATGGVSTVGLVPGIIGHTPLKLLYPEYASQIGWLYPLACAGLILGLIALRRMPATGRDEGLRTGVLLSVALLVTLTVIMSVMSLPHTAYLASMAFPLAGLSAIGALLLWRTSQLTTSRLRFALPLAVAVQTVWVMVLLVRYPDFARWLMVPIAVLGIGGAALLTAAARIPRRSRPLQLVAGFAAITASLLAPVVWSVSTVVPAYAGTANDAYAGPRHPMAYDRSAGNGQYGIGLDSNRATAMTAIVEAALFDYAKVHSGDRKYVLATDSWRSAAPLIMRGNERVLPIGGFSARVTAPSAHAVQQLVADGALKYVLLTAPESKNGANTPNISQLHRWVTSNCWLVRDDRFGAAPRLLVYGMSPDRLYQCAP